jgi:hypothetical protein
LYRHRKRKVPLNAESTQLFSFTHLIAEQMTPEERVRVIEMLWESVANKLGNTVIVLDEQNPHDASQTATGMVAKQAIIPALKSISPGRAEERRSRSSHCA